MLHKILTTDTTLQIQLSGPISDQGKSDLMECFHEILELEQKMVEFDFSNTPVVSSSNIGEFILLERKLRSNGRKIVFTDVQPSLNEIFEILYLGKIIPIKN